MSASLSHGSHLPSSEISPIIQHANTAREWGLRGYRPDTATFMAAVRKRQRTAFTQRNSWQSETRWLALYCTREDISSYDLVRELCVRRNDLRAMFAHYGLSYEQRNHLHIAQRKEAA